MTPGRIPPDLATEVIGQPLRKEQRLSELLRRPEIDYAMLMRLPGAGPAVTDAAVIEQLENSARYSGYIERQREDVKRDQSHEHTRIPVAIDYRDVRGLSNEAVQKLSDHRPVTVGQAARISGVTPAAISLLLIYLKKYGAALAKSA